MDDLQKQCALFAYVESKIITTNLSVNTNIACVNGHNIEVGKLIELLFIASATPFIMTNLSKEQTIYKVIINKEEFFIYPPVMFSSINGKLTGKLHYYNQNGETKYYCRESAETLEAYRQAIIGGRELVKQMETVELSTTGFDVK